jgi:hypothetical protein
LGDLQIGEAFQDRCFITVLATGLPATLLADVTTVFIDELGNRAAGVVTEQSNGWYTSPFTPDAAGTWAVEWSKVALPANYVFNYPYKEFKVGGGEVTDIKTDTGDIVNVHTHASNADTASTAAAADAVLLKADLGDASAATLGSVLGILGNPAAVSISTDVAATHAHAATAETQATAAAADAVLLKADLGDASASTLGSILAIVGNPAATSISTDVAAVHTHMDVVVADTPYIADAALPAAPTASSLASRLRAISVLETTIGPANRSTTSCELVAGDPHNSAYVNMIVVLDNDETNLNYVSRTVTAYTGASKTITWTPALTHDAVDGGKIWLCANDTKINVTADAIKGRTDRLEITKTFFSPCQIEVVADTSHTDANLPTVTLPDIAGTITHVYAGFKFRMVENTNAAVNKLSGAQEIQVDTVDAINFVDDQFGLAASTREGGDCIIGSVDLVATVNVFNHAYAFVWDEPLTDQDAIHFNDVQTFLIVSYY